MIISTIDTNEKKEKPFPKLMVTAEGMVVAFKDKGIGGIVYSVSDCEPVGYISNTWIMKNFTDFNGSITLSNEV